MPDSRVSVLVFLGAFLIRLIAWMGAAIFGTDSAHYLFMADALREGRFGEALSVPYHPLYPLLTALASLPFGHTPEAGGLVSVTLGAAAVLPLMSVVRAAFGRPEAFVAGLMYAFSPTILEVQADVMTEGTFMFFLIAAMAATWRQIEAPSPARAATLAAAAAAAYLTRPEGILAVVFGIAWPLGAALLRRPRGAMLAGGAALSAAVALLLVFPYLSWLHASTGQWTLSPRPSAVSALKSAGALFEEGPGEASTGMVTGFFKAILRATYLVTIPFYLIGIALLWKRRSLPLLFTLSWPIGYLAGVLFTLRVHNFMTHRYVLPAMAILAGVAALGVTASIRRASDLRLPALAAPGLILAVAVLPCAKAFAPNRWECRSYYDAARWIRAQGKPRAVSGPIQQVAYLSGGRSVYSAQTHDGVRQQVRREGVGYYVYTEKDLEKRPEYTTMLRTCDALEPPVEIAGPPGSWKVYVQRAR